MRLLVLLLFPLFSLGQDSLYHIFPLKNGVITYETTLPANSGTLSKAKAWILNHQPLRDARFQQDGSNIYANGMFSQTMMLPPLRGHDSLSTEHQYWYNIHVQLIDNQAVITLSDLRFSGTTATNLFTPAGYKEDQQRLLKGLPKHYTASFLNAVDKDFKNADSHIKTILQDLTTSLNNP